MFVVPPLGGMAAPAKAGTTNSSAISACRPWLLRSSWIVLLLTGTIFAKEPASEFEPSAYIQQHCIRCHGPDEEKADRRFDQLSKDLTDEENINQWQDILDAVNRGDMPPAEEQQPPTLATKQFVATLTQRIQTALQQAKSKNSLTFRRLNRYEYRNTIRDLCGVNIQSFDPTTKFPADGKTDGFENIGDELVISDYLLEQYLHAASATIDKALAVNDDHHIHRVFRADDLESRKFHFRPQISFQVNVDGRYVDVGHGDRFSDRVHPDEFDGVPADGYYTIRIKAEGVNRVHPYDTKLLEIDPTEPIKMEVLVADPRVGGRLSGNATDRSVAVVPLEDHEPKVYEFKTWMDKGFVPILRYINGPQPIKRILFRIAPKYHKESLPSNWRSGTDKRPAEEKEKYMSDVYQGPRMRIYRIELQGPHKQEPNARDVTLHARDAETKPLDGEQTIERFLLRAFRRPPAETEVTRYQDFFRARLARGDRKEAALVTTFKAILCSPGFLYIEVPQSEDAKAAQTQFRLASRLSYFLWSSMPDDELLGLAEAGKLDAPEVLVAQVSRMLKDSKSNALTENFTDSWLRLNDLGSMPPDTVKFPNYYKRRLEPLMKKETQHFFAHVLEENLGIEHFIDSDFTFLNRYVADHYGIAGIVGDDFQKVALPADSPRGGILGHASILTMTSNGVETSPVKRGIWVLENILGTPPAPPPPDVDPLEPDTRGASTIREQLVKHRDVETCAECHRKIDPIGFALESFDPIGVFRTEYVDEDSNPTHQVDTAGQLANGESFADLAELKKLLRDRQDQFAKCLTEKMLTYAIGRELTIHDAPQVDVITKELVARGSGLRDLVALIVLSDSFRK